MKKILIITKDFYRFKNICIENNYYANQPLFVYSVDVIFGMKLDNCFIYIDEKENLPKDFERIMMEVVFRKLQL
jgi:hypothetical protein